MEVGKNTKLFEGVEVEGRYKGLKTLFVVGDVEFSDIQNAVAHNEYEQIYFGAYFQSVLTNYKTIKAVRLVFKGVVTIEMDYETFPWAPAWLIEDRNIHKIITYKSIPNSENVTFKIENKKGIYCTKDYIYNDWSVYENDKVILEETK